MVNFWNNINPSSVNFNLHSNAPVSQPPLNNPLPNNILPPGFRPQLPTRAIPAPSGNLKKALNNLPSLFNLTSNNGQ